MVSRSFDAGNISMPPTANIISGKTSVCSSPLVEASRSASVPGSAAAWPAKESTPPSRRRSAKRNTLIMARTRISIQQNSAGPSTARAPSATTLPDFGLLEPGFRSRKTITEVTIAAISPSSASTTWTT